MQSTPITPRPPLDLNEIKREAIRDEAVADFVALANRTITSAPLRSLLNAIWAEWMKREQGIGQQNQDAALSTLEGVCAAELHRAVTVLDGGVAC